MTRIYEDGVPMRRERSGELVPDEAARPPRPCTPNENRTHAARIRSMLQEAHSA